MRPARTGLRTVTLPPTTEDGLVLDAIPSTAAWRVDELFPLRPGGAVHPSVTPADWLLSPIVSLFVV